MDKKNLIEVVGILSVVISLLFVGYELRQNTSVSRYQAYNDSTSRFQDLTLFIAADNELSELQLKMRTASSLDEYAPLEIEKLLNLFYATTRTFEGQYRAYQAGLIQNSDLATGSGGLVNNSTYRLLWPRSKILFGPDFVEWWEGKAWNQ